MSSRQIRKLREVHFLQESGDGGRGLPQIGGHGSLAVSGNPFIFNFYLHVRRALAAVGGYREGVREFQLIREELQVHAPVPLADMKTLRPAGAAREGDSGQCQ